MIRLSKPNIDIDAYIKAVVEERQGGPNAMWFASIRADWSKRCHDYDDAGGDPGSLPSWQEAMARKTRFKTLYASPQDGSTQGAVIAALRDRTMQFCPVCGEAGTPNTLDHYLPQDSYPDFAILPLNLVPTCDICQRHKLAKTTGPDGRLFLHPYFDACLDNQVVRLRFHPPYATPTVELVCHPDVPPKWAGLIGRHLAELQLPIRLEKFFNKEFLRVLKLAKRARERGADIANEIERFRDHAADRSLNSWEHLLWEGALADQALVNHLAFGDLPDHL